jgi:simple sugar transport system ATP-binding protein
MPRNEAAPASWSGTGPLVEMRGIVKDFPNVRAIDGGRFDLEAGEIHALIGENGAGKSTLMKTLYGLYAPEEGEIRIRGEAFPCLSPAEAIRRGIGMVHQEFMLVRELTVLENIILGFEPRRGGRIDFREAEARVRRFVEDYGLQIQLHKRVNDISVGEAQRVEIIKALYRGAEILILDEPTAVLTPQEASRLFEILRTLRSDGKSLVFISHKLREVMEISDRITVMRQGKYVATLGREETSCSDLARLMVGREVFLGVQRSRRAAAGETVLSVEEIFVPGDKELSKLRGVSFRVRAGEVLGIAGIDGNGQSELAEALAGLRPVERGRVLLKGKEIQNRSPLEIRREGFAHIPEDRNRRGLNRTMTVEENLAGLAFRDPPLSRGIALLAGAVRRFAEGLIRTFDIRPPRPEASAGGFSGGNAQKIVVAREIDAGADLLLASQPTRGVDVGSIENIRKELVRVRDGGTAILLISADLEEILSLSDRIAVLYEGRITGILDAEEADEERLGLLMTGGALGA